MLKAIRKSTVLGLTLTLLTSSALLTGCGASSTATRKAKSTNTADNNWNDDNWDDDTNPDPSPDPNTGLSPAIKQSFRIKSTNSAELPSAGVSTDGKLIVKVFAMAPDSLGATGVSTQYGPSNFVPDYVCAQYDITLQVQDSSGKWEDTETIPTGKILAKSSNQYEDVGYWANPCEGATKHDIVDFSEFVKGRGTGKVRIKVSNTRTDHFCYFHGQKCGDLSTTYHTHNVKGKVHIQTDTTTLD